MSHIYHFWHCSIDTWLHFLPQVLLAAIAQVSCLHTATHFLSEPRATPMLYACYVRALPSQPLRFTYTREKTVRVDSYDLVYVKEYTKRVTIQ